MSDKHLFSNKWTRSIAILLPVLIGIAVIVIAPRLKSPPQTMETAERATKVRVIKVSKIDIVPRVVGFGKVSPARTWESVAEVAGQVVWIADELRDGRIIKAGTELLRIEDANYKLALSQADAQLRAAKAKSKATEDALLIARKELKLLQTEYERQKQLASTGTISKTALDNTERQVLAGQTQLQNLQNTLDLNAAERQVLIAQRDAAKLDLERTRKVAPFDVRITAVDIGKAQYANKGQLMFKADSLDVAEVEAQFQVGVLRPLINRPGTDDALTPGQGALGLNAVVRLRTASHMVAWPARVDRISGSIDPQTQTIGVVVAVDRPYEAAQPGQRPPLLRETFVEVELSSPPIKEQIVVPLNSVHRGEVYVVNDESRLEKRKVKVSFSQQGYAVIGKGIKPGERIVSSDLISAVEGMLLDAQEDIKTQQRLIKEATGGGVTAKEAKK